MAKERAANMGHIKEWVIELYLKNLPCNTGKKQKPIYSGYDYKHEMVDQLEYIRKHNHNWSTIRIIHKGRVVKEWRR